MQNSKKFDINSFIQSAKLIHSNIFDYSNTSYSRHNGRILIRIKCNKHGIFEQRYDSHLRGNGCPACAIETGGNKRKSNTVKFITKAKAIHEDKYDYNLVDYIGTNKKIKIICPEHNVFEQTPTYHLNGYGCRQCSLLTANDFISQSNIVHGNKYDYSMVNYKNLGSKITIICPNHGKFNQVPNNHKRGQGCPRCAGKFLTNTEIINAFKKTHGDKYNYSLVNYKKGNNLIKIICQEHGMFEQTANAHKKGNGCHICGGNKQKNTNELILEFNKTHNYKYDYSLVNYKNFHTPIKIICRNHNIFKQTPNNHKKGQGCPCCSESKGEREIFLFLKQNKIEFIQWKKFENCKHKRQLPFDFYIPEHNICIEFNGLQHYESIPFWGGEREFKLRQLRDKIKIEYCEKNNIRLSIIKYNESVNDKMNSLLESLNLARK